MRFIDLFAGIGGFRKGMEANGHQCVFSCEIDSAAVRSYKALFGEEDVFPDMRDLHPGHVPQFDVLCAGFPCQPFSRAGRRNGLEHQSGDLFGHVARFTEEMIEAGRPIPILVLENVRGLLTCGERRTCQYPDGRVRHDEINKGVIFMSILTELNRLGYDVQWQLINSARYIAHKRERVYMVATRKEDASVLRRILPLEGAESSMPRKELLGDISKARQDLAGNLCFKRPPYFFGLTKDGMHRIRNAEEADEFEFGHESPFRHWGMMVDGLCVTADLSYPMPVHPLNEKLQPPNEIEEKYLLSDKEVARQRHAKDPKEWKASGLKMGRMAFPDGVDKPSRTLTANSSGREMMVLAYGPERFRRLTTLEYWRLQGFSDSDYKKALDAGVPESQLRRQAGNAVTVNVVKEVAARLDSLANVMPVGNSTSEPEAAASLD